MVKYGIYVTIYSSTMDPSWVLVGGLEQPLAQNPASRGEAVQASWWFGICTIFWLVVWNMLFFLHILNIS